MPHQGGISLLAKESNLDTNFEDTLDIVKSLLNSYVEPLLIPISLEISWMVFYNQTVHFVDDIQILACHSTNMVAIINCSLSMFQPVIQFLIYIITKVSLLKALLNHTNCFTLCFTKLFVKFCAACSIIAHKVKM